LINAAITFDDAEQQFETIAPNGTYEDTWPVEELRRFSDRISVSLKINYPNSDVYDKHLKRSPATIPASMSSIDTEGGGNEEQEVAEPFPGLKTGAAASTSTTRAKLPAKLTGKCSRFSAATKVMLQQLEIEIEHFAAEAFSDKKASQHSHAHLEIARKIIKWRLYQTNNIQAFISPSKSMHLGKPAEAKGLMEEYVQKLLSRVLFPLCKALDLTLHDARSYPKVHSFVVIVLTRAMSLTSSSSNFCSYSLTGARAVVYQAIRTLSSALKIVLSGSSR
jgi:hypothetical protein